MNTKRAPKVRFKGFTDAWELRKFGDMADYKKGPFGSALKKEIFIPKSDDSVKVYEQQNAINKNWKLERYFITKSYAKKLNAFETHSGDILISCAGTIGEMYELPDESEPGIINQALMRVRVNEKVVSKKLYKLLFNHMIEDFSKEYSNGSAIKNIPPFADLKPMTAMVPSMEEQFQLSGFFANLDNLITLHQRKLDKMKELKKAFLNLIFSQKLRFYGFTDSWELRKLEEVAPLRGGYAFQSNQYANEGIPIVRISNILSDGSVGGEFVFHNELKDDEIFMLENGDIVLAMSGATTGKVSILSSEKSCKYYQNQRVGLFSKTATCNYSFVATIVRSEKFLEQLRDVLVAGAQPNVSAKDIDAFDFSVPKDVEEQSQIGNFFRTLDRLITLYQKKIDSSKEMKKILLKNMLI